MVSRFVALAAIFLSAATVQAELQWDKPIQEFHREPADRSVETKFAFKNVGSTPITIENIRTTCGCTSADLEKRLYAPGESGAITVKFTFGSRVGPMHKPIRVFSSDKGDEPTVLDLRVYVNEAITLTPSLVFWRTGQPGDAKTVQISSPADRPVRVKGIRSSNPKFTAKLETQKVGESYLVTVKPSDTSAKESAEISVDTDYPPDAPRTYFIYARIK